MADTSESEWAAPSSTSMAAVCGDHQTQKVLGSSAEGPEYWTQVEETHSISSVRTETLSAKDAQQREEERAARVTLGQVWGEDAVAPVITLLGPNQQTLNLPEPERPKYVYITNPGTRLGEEMDMVSTYEEFASNFSLLTLGLAPHLFADLPLVAAGGAVLAALHTWPGVHVPPSAPATAWIGGVVENYAARSEDFWSDYGRWHRHSRRTDEIAKLQVEVAQLMGTKSGNCHLGADKAALLGRVVQMHAGKDLCLADGKLAYSTEESANPTDRRLRSYASTDVDLFLTTRSPDAAIQTLGVLYQRLKKFYGDVFVSRTKQAVTFVGPRPHRSVQVILRLYGHEDQVILGFDVDCCAVSYDGQRVRACPRAARALASRYNLVDETRQSMTYEPRLAKYMRRGFDVGIPCQIDLAPLVQEVRADLLIQITANVYRPFHGLASLIAHLETARARKLAGRRRSVSKLPSTLAPRSDYGAGQYPRNALEALRAFRLFALLGQVPPYICGGAFGTVISQNECALGGTTYKADVPVCISFMRENPLAQNRTDCLYTGSFHPIETSWLPKKDE